MAIGRFLAPLNGNTLTTSQPKPYVDDIFDPLFNKQVIDYYNGIYGNNPLGRLAGIGSGYADMIDNALTGQKGILGPGMGILSTFGRSMDKADDLILGGLTEGINALGTVTGGSNVAPTNPITNIFRNDYDYEGTKLLAAAGNAMAGLAQTPGVRLDQSDFQTVGDRIAGTTLDLATDPGILGGQLARLNKGTPVGQIGQIMSSYDDAVANIAGNMAFPGGKYLVGKTANLINDRLFGNASSTPLADAVTSRKSKVDLNNLTDEDVEALYQQINKARQNRRFALDYNSPEVAELLNIKQDLLSASKGAINPWDTPALYETLKMGSQDVMTPVLKQSIYDKLEFPFEEVDDNIITNLNDAFTKRVYTAANDMGMGNYVDTSVLDDIENEIQQLEDRYTESGLEKLNTLSDYIPEYQYENNDIVNAPELSESAKNLTRLKAAKNTAEYKGKQREQIYAPFFPDNKYYEYIAPTVLDAIDKIETKYKVKYGLTESAISDVIEQVRKSVDYETPHLNDYTYRVNELNTFINNKKRYDELNAIPNSKLTTELKNEKYTLYKKLNNHNVFFKTVNLTEKEITDLYDKYKRMDSFFDESSKKIKTKYAIKEAKNALKSIADKQTLDLEAESLWNSRHITFNDEDFPKEVISEVYKDLHPNQKATRDLMGNEDPLSIDTDFKRIRDIVEENNYSYKNIDLAIERLKNNIEDLKNLNTDIDKNSLQLKIENQEQAIEILNKYKQVIGEFNDTVLKYDLPKKIGNYNYAPKLYDFLYASVRSKPKNFKEFITNILGATKSDFSDTKGLYNIEDVGSVGTTNLYEVAQFGNKGLVPWVMQNKTQLEALGTKESLALIDMAEEINNKITSKLLTTPEQLKAYQNDIRILFNHTPLTGEYTNPETGVTYSYDNLKDRFYDEVFTYEKNKDNENLILINEMKKNSFLRSNSKLTDDSFLYEPSYKRISDIFNVAKPKTKVSPDIKNNAQALAANDAVSKLSPEDFTKFTTELRTLNNTISDEVFNAQFGAFAKRWGIPEYESKAQLSKYIRKYGTVEEKRFLTLYDSAVSSNIKNKIGLFGMGSSRNKQIYDLRKKSQDLALSTKYKDHPEHIKNYIIISDVLDSKYNVIKGQDMLTRIVKDGAVDTASKDKKFIDALEVQLKSNVDKINKAQNSKVLTTYRFESDGWHYLGYKFDASNINITKDYNKLCNSIASKMPKDLVDLQMTPILNMTKQELMKKLGYTDPHFFDDLDDLFYNTRGISSDIYKKLGFTNMTENYVKHAMTSSKEGAAFWNTFNKNATLDDYRLNKITEALQDYDYTKKALRADDVQRTHLGPVSAYGNGYSTDLDYIVTSTFTKGTFENSNVQTFVECCLSDNFKIKHNFDSVDRLKSCLFLKNRDGKISGNLRNVELVSPIYSKEGVLTGFTRYNKFDNDSLLKAYNDENCVLLPKSVIGPLDRVLKKDARMSSRFVQVVNRYFTIPWKMGTLANPGFIIGNMSDASCKQVMTMLDKYHTDLPTETANLTYNLRRAFILENEMGDIFDEYCTWLKNLDFNSKDLPVITNKPSTYFYDTFASSKKAASYLDPAIIVNNPKYANAWNAYLNYILKDPEKLKTAKLYTFLNDYYNTSTFKNNYSDLQDIRDAQNNANPYKQPHNVVERLMYGKPNEQGFKSWGLFLNNPYIDWVLNKSNVIESTWRSSMILNDLEHQGFSSEKISEILGLDPKTEKEIYNQLHIKASEAVNTMNTANFDYDSVTDFMNKSSYIFPFPTFYLKNIGYWLEQFANNPQYIDNIISAHNGMWAGQDTSKDEFAAEAKGRGAVPFGIGNKHLTGIAKQMPYNSMFGAFNSINNFKEDFAYRTNPIARPITHHLQKDEDVKYRPYSTNPYEKNIRKGDSNFSQLAYLFHQLNPYERTVNTYSRTPKKIANDSWQLSDFLPSMIQPNFGKKSK